MNPDMNRHFALMVIVVLVPAVGVAQQTQRGVALGALGGAIAGGIIGDHNDKAGAGAAIGGALGAVAGGILGNASDKERAAAQQRYYYDQQQRQTYHVQQQAIQTQSAVSVSDVVAMSRSGLSESVIRNQIQQRGVQQQLQVHDIISLHQQGVSEGVITAMQQAPVGSPRTLVASPPVHVVTPAPVVVEEHYVVPSYPPPTYHIHRHPTTHFYGHW
jgi:outer membrane lipoprotein SlyB